MWNWLNCYLSGRHDFGVSCEPGTIFLRCMHCGKRSSGWALEGQPGRLTPAKAHLPARPVVANTAMAGAAAPLPFRQRGMGRLRSA